MTRERIEDIREIVFPFVRNVLLKTNYENLGKSDAEEFTRDFNEILDLATKALEQEPKTGHWVLTDVEGYRVWHCNCSECGKDPQDYIGGSENWWLIKSKLPKFCPNCGVPIDWRGEEDENVN